MGNIAAQLFCDTRRLAVLLPTFYEGEDREEWAALRVLCALQVAVTPQAKEGLAASPLASPTLVLDFPWLRAKP